MGYKTQKKVLTDVPQFFWLIFGKDIFSGADAVRMATINGARCMGIENDFGTIEVGKKADLVVFDGNPFEDHSVVGGRVAALFKDGKLIINNCMLQVSPNVSKDKLVRYTKRDTIFYGSAFTAHKGPEIRV